MARVTVFVTLESGDKYTYDGDDLYWSYGESDVLDILDTGGLVGSHRCWLSVQRVDNPNTN